MTSRQRFVMPTGDIQSADPELPGGGVGVEHMHGNDPSTWTPAPSELDRYRGLGEAAAARQAYQVNFGKAMGDESQGFQDRNQQIIAASGLRNAAEGNAPSQAAILGNQAAGQSLEAQMAASANGRGGVMTRGGIGAAAAQAQAAQGAQQQQLGNVGQFAGMRGAEMAHAQGAYGAAGGTMRTGDYAQQGMAQQRAEAQGQSEFTQRQLNQQGQMGFEQMGINDQQANVDAELRKAAMRNQANQAGMAASDATQARNMKIYSGTANAVGSLAGDPGLGDQTSSDERTKDRIVPLRDERDGRGEQHYDADVSKAKPDVTSGASLSGPTPKYSIGEPARPSMAATVAKAPRKLTDAELKKLGEELKAHVAAQHTMLDEGPSVRRVASGTKENGYNTELTDGAEKAYGDWANHVAPGDDGRDYDYRGAFAAGQGRGGTNGHFTDQFKKPNHETFSDESQYAPSSPETAGRWDGDSYVPKGPPAWLRQNMESESQGVGAAYAQRYAYSDDHTKVVAAQREAFTAGLNHANEARDTGKLPEAPSYMTARKQPPQAPRKAATPTARADDTQQREENAASQKVYDRAPLAAAMAVPLGFGATAATHYRELREDADNEERRMRPPPPLPPPMLSDERTKRDASPENDMGRALEQGFKPFEYEYKPGFAEQEHQAPGEKNVGPMAQDMATNSITGSAVKRGPGGLLVVDIPKATKVNSAGIGYLAARQRELEEQIASLKGGRHGAR